MASPEGEAERFILEVWILQGTAYLMVGLRYFNRIHSMGFSGLTWDDLLMLFATLTYTAESVMAHLVVAYWRGLANNAMTEDQRASLSPTSEEYLFRVNGSKTHVAGLLLYTTLLWLLKGCWTIYYARLTSGVHKMKLLIRGAYIMMPLTYVGCLLVAFLKCIPFEKQWQIYPNPGNNCEPAISTLQTIFVMIMNTLTDLLLMSIPLPMIWKSSLPLRKKFFLLIMFSGGLLEMTFGILRCTSILTLGDIDPAQSGYWSVRESFVSFVLTNMPMVYPLIKGVVEKGMSSIGVSKGGTRVNTEGYRLGSYPTRTHLSRKQGPITAGGTEWGSEENIVDGKGNDIGEQLPIQGGVVGGGDKGIMVAHEYTITET
ncbi:hypothetical protein OQA88_2152 [Cercophora sp. LCS_1]